MLIDLPFPHKLLWPNGRTRQSAWKRKEQAKAKDWAFLAAKAATRPDSLSAPIPVALTVCAKPTGKNPDADNCVAAAKYYLDGIALALGIDDKDFAAPTVEYGPRASRFVIEIGG